MKRMGFRIQILVLVASSVAVSPAHALKFRIPPLQELVCKSDVVVIGALHVYLASGIGITTTGTGTDANGKPFRETMPARYYDQGQITHYTGDPIRFIKDDSWKNTIGVVNVVLKSTGTYPPGMDPGEVTRDKENWLWLLHREEVLGQYYVLKQLPLSEEKSVTAILKEGKCEKRQ